MFIQSQGSPHLHNRQRSVRSVMLGVSYALVPAILVYAWLFGAGILINIVLAGGLALAFEAAFLKLRGRELAPALGDGSALLTALLLAMALPPLAPWWLVLLGVFFAIVVAKHLYGGLGYNPFNPAMIGYAVLLISFPLEMTTWPAPLADGQSLGLMGSLAYVFTGQLPAGLGADAITGATPLDNLKTQLDLGRDVAQIRSETTLFGSLGGAHWEWINLAILGGGLWLIWRRLITWHIPVAMLGTLALLALVFYVYDPTSYASPLFHLFSGAAMLGAFFIATDPVTAATSNRGKLWFGAGIGLFTFVIRSWGGYPDGVAFAVLLMNMAAPTIDYYTTPRVFGGNKGDGKS
ncbi:MAG: electron transport complex subunit RsxD [Gammaproteobacteria bacterium]|nr:electron transport complex subunit RsxD [Gammaproteobacteria bacterium]